MLDDIQKKRLMLENNKYIEEEKFLEVEKEKIIID